MERHGERGKRQAWGLIEFLSSKKRQEERGGAFLCRVSLASRILKESKKSWLCHYRNMPEEELERMEGGKQNVLMKGRYLRGGWGDKISKNDSTPS